MSNKHTCTTASLLKRPIPDSLLSLYLDFYPAIRRHDRMKMTRRKYLGTWVYICEASQRDSAKL
jgi:hypothetical protein